jgi:glycosyltransferase involved in cell wall biosynthesis
VAKVCPVTGSERAPDAGEPGISVVMPAHNEEQLLAESVAAVATGLRQAGPSFEIVIVENGSADRTWTLAQRLAEQQPEVRALQTPRADYGRALRTGFLAARGRIIVSFDVDFYDLDFLAAAVARVDEPDGPAIVVGTKRGAGALDTRPFLRRTVTAVFSSILRVGFGLRVSDTHGIKALRRAPLVPIIERCEFGLDLFDTELVLRAERAGLATAELPVVVEERRPARSSIARRIPRTILNLLRLRLALWRNP